MDLFEEVEDVEMSEGEHDDAGDHGGRDWRVGGEG